MNSKVWPISIISFLVFVICFNVFFAVLANKTSIGEIEEDSYHKGLNYQSEIDLENNAKNLDLKVDFVQEGSSLKVVLKKSGVAASADELKLQLKRADEVKLDVVTEQQCGVEGCYITLDNLKPGLWLYNLQGKIENKSFLLKGSKVTIQNI
ncbi:MAG: FixH family protein [Proteobacteria bacterium]|nr:FixH family protein [Pseudomonadota bacterium]